MSVFGPTQSGARKHRAVPLWAAMVFGACVGCGGGPLHTGGLGPFSSSYIPDTPIAMEDLPPFVRFRAEDVILGQKLDGVIRNHRPSDGRLYYTITYSDEARGQKEISYWHDGKIKR